MGDVYTGLALRRLIRIKNVASGADVQAISDANARLYRIFVEREENGALDRASFSLHHYPDLMPNLCLLDIDPTPVSDRDRLSAAHLRLRFMGSGLDHVYGMQTGATLNEYQNKELAQSIVVSVNMLRKEKTIISGGVLFDSLSGPLLLQATFLPIARIGHPIDQVMVYISRSRDNSVES